MRTPELFRVKHAWNINPHSSQLMFHSDTVKFLHVFSKWGYYTLQVPYKITRQDGMYDIRTNSVQMGLCGLMHLANLAASLLATWRGLSLRTDKISEDPFSWFCILRDVLPNFTLATYIYIVWIKPRGLKYLYQESCRFCDGSKTSSLSTRQTLLFCGYIAFLYGPFYLGEAAGILRSAVQGNTMEGWDELWSRYGIPGTPYFPITLLLKLFNLYEVGMTFTTFFGMSRLACLLVAEISHEVEAQIMDTAKFPSVQDITEFYETVKTLISAINEALSDIVGATLVNSSIFFGILLFSFFDNPSLAMKFVVGMAIAITATSLQAAAKAYGTMNGSIRNFIFKNQRNLAEDGSSGMTDLLGLESMIENEPLALYAGKFSLTYGLLVSMLSTSITNFLIMLQFMGQKTKCRVF